MRVSLDAQQDGDGAVAPRWYAIPPRWYAIFPRWYAICPEPEQDEDAARVIMHEPAAAPGALTQCSPRGQDGNSARAEAAAEASAGR